MGSGIQVWTAVAAAVFAGESGHARVSGRRFHGEAPVVALEDFGERHRA